MTRPATTARLLALPFLAASLLGGAPAAFAQTASSGLPDGPVRLVIPTTPGSTPDIIARAIAPKLGERLARPIVVENKVGASGAIGTEAVVRAAPTGATLLLAASTLATGASLQPTTGYSVTRDLAPITLMGWNRLVLVTPAKTGFANVADLVAAAKKAPGKLNYGSPGNGTPNHLAAELFKLRTGTDIVHVPYRGSGPQLADALAGQVELAPLTIIAAAPHVASGKLVALAITGEQRSSLLPGVPALSEVGVPGVQGDIWYGLFAPAGTPADVIAKLNAEVRAVLRGEEKTLATQGIDVDTGTPEALAQLLARDTARWAELIRTQGIKGD